MNRKILVRIKKVLLILVEILAVFVIAYSIWGWTLYFMQPTYLYRPVREVFYTPEELGLSFEGVILSAADGVKLSAWFVPAKGAEYTILFCHGNGGNMTHRLDSINLFHDIGLNCLIFDYRGYGESEGRASEEGTYLDAMAAYEWLVKEKKVSATNIIIFGKSLGGSIASQLASQVEAGSLVLESAFTSYVDMGEKLYPYMPVRWFARFNYNTVDYIKDVRCPVMIIHSRDDEIVPFEFGLKLYNAANKPNEFVEIFGSHNDGFLVCSEIYKKAWVKWLKFLEQQDSGSEQHQAS